MLHKELKNFKSFTVKKEPESVFYKESNRHDGTVNSYKTESKSKIPVPFIFGAEDRVIELAEYYI